jgi:DtxR family Mn-dependent transcriptional regulator
LTDDLIAERPSGGTPVTPAMQDYLKAVYRLGANGPVATQQLADELGVAASSATNMAKRLHEQGLLSHTPYHGVELTAEGRQVALDVIRRHRLLETFLAEKVGLGWDEVHDEAERLEHHLSDILELPAGAAGIVSRVSDRDPEHLRYLGALGIVPGARVDVLEHLPFEGPVRIRVSIDGREPAEHVLGRPLAGVIRLSR